LKTRKRRKKMSEKKFRVFEVGGHVRDQLLGIQSKDVDCSVEAPSFQDMLEFVEATTEKIFQVREEYVTIRAMGFDGQPKDFVLCRKDGAYSDGRRPDAVEVGTIYDDLARRDFTINAMAVDVDTGEFLDPFGGREDLENKILRCVGSAAERFEEDSLRIIRAIRFAITKGFEPDEEIWEILSDSEWAEKLSLIARDRIRGELLKCFRFSTSKTLKFLFRINHHYLTVIFDGEPEIWLKPTLEDR
jgi:tRNA nucleotidyltransferase (CCA-adding enzyme)